MNNRHIVLAITGASGSVYGLRLGQELLREGHRLTMLITDAGFDVIRHETGLEWRGDEAAITGCIRDYYEDREQRLGYYGINNFLAPAASGSSAPDAMAICPCSMGTLSRVASGNSGNLAERCADVMLKERRPLVVVPRETPLNDIHLENMLRLSRAGARIVPAMPAFYHGPETVDDMVNFVVGKVLDALGVGHSLYRRWGK
ncbi:MAG TPA: flavin prenyltransferase UbiX [Geobacteraceae bacterium]|nr:flavin prenyltransferase UbiX [Geobacteraceae bacterium]